MFKRLKTFKSISKKALAQKGLGRKIKYMSYALTAQKNGVVRFRLDRIAQEYTDNYFDLQGVSNEDKTWFAKRGYSPHKIPWYKLTRDNYTDYISDFVFYNRKNYVNKKFDAWFDNKLTTYFVLSPFKSNMPIHFYYKDANGVYAIAAEGKGDIEDILQLAQERELALKSTTGGHGDGFYKLEYNGKDYLVNGKPYDKDQTRSFLGGLSGYIITSYERPRQLFSELCGENTFGVMRIYMINDKEDGPQMIAGCIRLGSKASGYVTGYEGTVYCGIELETGKLFRQIYMKSDYEYVYIDKHPDTGKVLEGVEIPDWKDVQELTSRISNHIPMTPYLVIDIIPSENGLKVLEINSHGQFAPVEAFYPAMKNKYVRKLFKE